MLSIPDGVGDLNGWQQSVGLGWAKVLADSVAGTDEVTAAPAAARVRDFVVYPSTDDGQALWVNESLKRAGNPVRYAPGNGWLMLDHGVWQSVSEWRIRGEVQRVARDDHRVAAVKRTYTRNDPADLVQTDQTAIAYQSVSRVDGVMKTLPGLPEVFVEDHKLDAHPDVLAALNGVIDLRTGENLGYRPDLLLTKRVNFDYDPDAKAPRWQALLEEALPHDGLVDYLQTLIGYGITGRTTEQIFAIFHGTGANSKSTVTDTLGQVFSEFTGYPSMTSFTGKREAGAASDDLASLRGVRLALTNEADDGVRLDEAKIKELTGDTEITARHLHQSQFTFRPEFLIVMATNYKPALRGIDEALWRRIHMVPWTAFIPQERRIQGLANKIVEEEASGILTWAVQGAAKWYQHKLDVPAVVRQATAEYRRESDPLHGYIGDVIVLAPGEAPLQELYDKYLVWCDAEGDIPDRRRMGKRKLKTELLARGAKEEGRKGGKGNAMYLSGVRVV